MSTATAVNDKSFSQQVIASEKPVLVDFWAQWCGPCRAIAPTLDYLADQYEGIQVVKLNVDENPKVTAEHGIRSIPTLKLFNNGRVVETVVGSQSRSSLEALVLRHVE